MNARFRPLLWQGPSTPAAQRRSRWTFRASWQDTLDLLERELDHLAAKEVVIEADFSEGDIRLDGWPRGNARQPVHPGIRVAFESKHGPLVYSSDTCEFWQHNLRSIGLGLEALRAVDRYGVTRRGEQYTGWRQIAAGPSAPTFASDADAWTYLLTVTDEAADTAPTHSADVRRVVNRARRLAHPDTGGTAVHWQMVQDAADRIKAWWS